MFERTHFCNNLDKIKIKAFLIQSEYQQLRVLLYPCSTFTSYIIFIVHCYKMICNMISYHIMYKCIYTMHIPRSESFFLIFVGGSPTSWVAACVVAPPSAPVWEEPYHPPHPGNHLCKTPVCSSGGGNAAFSGSGV